jgi:hypothetical protein
MSTSDDSMPLQEELDQAHHRGDRQVDAGRLQRL